MFSVFDFFRKKQDAQQSQAEQLRKVEEKIKNTNNKSDPCTATMLRLLRPRAAGCVPDGVLDLYQQHDQKFNQEMNKAAPHGMKAACEVIERNFSDYMRYTVELAVTGAELQMGKGGAEGTVQSAITQLDEATKRVQRCHRLFPNSSKESQIKEAQKWQDNLSEFVDLHQKCRISRGGSK